MSAEITLWLGLSLVGVLLLGWALMRLLRPSARHSASASGALIDSSQQCIEGLNYLLNNQQDKALELFIKLVQVNDETIETHIALGNIYRRTGETEKAIQLHQNLLARPNLSAYQRSLSLYELGMDFFNAGLLDRAENLFREVVELDVQKIEAWQRLLSIYILEKSWLAASEVAEKLLQNDESGAQKTLTHCYCELAEIELNNNRNSSARQWIELALKQDSECARACLLKLEMLYRGGEYALAAQVLRQCAFVDHGCVDQFIEAAKQVCLALGDNGQYEAFLKQAAEKVQTDYMVVELAGLYRQKGQGEQALELMLGYLHKKPSLLVVDYMMRYYAPQLTHSESLWLQLQNVLQQLQDQEKTHQCRACGYESNLHHWQCPGCGEWSSMVSRLVAPT